MAQNMAQWKTSTNNPKVKQPVLFNGVTSAPKMLPAMPIVIRYPLIPVEVAYTPDEHDVFFHFLKGKSHKDFQQLDSFALREAFLAVKTPGEAIHFLSSSGHFRGGRTEIYFSDGDFSGAFSDWPGARNSPWNRISWSEFVSWQQIVHLMMANGGRIPWIDAPGTGSGHYDLAENLLDLVNSLGDEEQDWTDGRPTDINIRADGSRKDSRGRTEIYAEIRVCSTLEAIFASVYIDTLNGVNYALCALHDCDKLFEIASGHVRQYCSQACAHKASVRRRRAEAKRLKEAAAKQPAKSKAKKGKG